MSHGKVRKENDCLNCGIIVTGRYCQSCGQENIEPKETLWSMFVHFFTDITHFDGKFFKTLGILFTKPGLLSLEYIKGKRVKYLNPIRMYVFTSWVFFSLFFIFVTLPDSPITRPGNTVNITDIYNEVLKNANTAADSAAYRTALKKALPESDGDNMADSVDSSLIPGLGVHSPLELLPRIDTAFSGKASSKPSGLSNRIARKFETKWREKVNERQFWVKAADKFVHSFPYMLFVSLPLYALYLYLLYWRRRRQYYYADHGLFLIHLYIFTFIWLLVYVLFTYMMSSWPGTSLLINWTLTGMMIYGMYYAYKSMRVFYGQGRTKTLLKFIMFNTLCFFSIAILFLIFFGISAYRVME